MTTRRSFMGAAASAAAVSVLREGGLARVQAASRATSGRGPEAVAADEDYWREIQQAFTVDRTIINLNNGGVSPSPADVHEALKRYLDRSNECPVYTMWEILEPGDEILTTNQDYGRMLTTWRQRERREGLVLKTISFPTPPPSMDDLAQRFERAITPKTRVILVCHITNLTGQIFPIKQIARLGREHGIEVIVDGAHAFAHFPFTRDDLDCDYYGTSLHKWLLAPIGSGFLYVRKEKVPKLWPLMAAPGKMDDDVRKYEEIGTHPAANHNAVAEALTFHNGIGVERKAARLRYLRDRWALRLKEHPRVRLLPSLDPEMAGAIATVNIEGVDPRALKEHLWKQRRVFVVPIVHDEFQGIRVTPNIYTTLDEVDVFAEEMEHVIQRGLPA